MEVILESEIPFPAVRVTGVAWALSSSFREAAGWIVLYKSAHLAKCNTMYKWCRPVRRVLTKNVYCSGNIARYTLDNAMWRTTCDIAPFGMLDKEDLHFRSDYCPMQYDIAPCNMP